TRDILVITAAGSSGQQPRGQDTPEEASLFINAMPRYEILSENAMEVLDQGWRRIVSELGIEFLLPEAVELLRGAGQRVEEGNRVHFDPEFILEQVAKAPRE